MRERLMAKYPNRTPAEARQLEKQIQKLIQIYVEGRTLVQHDLAGRICQNQHSQGIEQIPEIEITDERESPPSTSANSEGFVRSQAVVVAMGRAPGRDCEILDCSSSALVFVLDASCQELERGLAVGWCCGPDMSSPSSCKCLHCREFFVPCSNNRRTRSASIPVSTHLVESFFRRIALKTTTDEQMKAHGHQDRAHENNVRPARHPVGCLDESPFP
jgi:hypothetical protein